MRICLFTTCIISRNINLLDVLVSSKRPVNRCININAVNIIDSSNIVLLVCSGEQLLTVTSKEEATKLNVATDIKGNMTVRISLYYSSRVTTTIYISTNIRL